MEKYGCNKTANIKLRIKEIESINFKCAADLEELKDLKKELVDVYDDESDDEDADDRCCTVADLSDLKKIGSLSVEDL